MRRGSERCNGGGNHGAAYWGREVMRGEVEVEVQQIRRKEGKITYAEAVRIAGQEKQSKDSG